MISMVINDIFSIEHLKAAVEAFKELSRPPIDSFYLRGCLYNVDHGRRIIRSDDDPMLENLKGWSEWHIECKQYYDLFAHTPQSNGFMDTFTSLARQMGKTQMYIKFIQEIILKRNAKLKQVDPDLCAALRKV